MKTNPQGNKAVFPQLSKDSCQVWWHMPLLLHHQATYSLSLFSLSQLKSNCVELGYYRQQPLVSSQVDG